MNVEMKLGRWRARDGSVHVVLAHVPSRFYPWLGEADWEAWSDTGRYSASVNQNDLIEYLGPIELSPTPACAEAGPAGDPQTVSTEDPQESLKRMKRLEATIHRELEIYLPLVARLKTTASDLDEAIKMLEKEVEG